MTKHAFCVLIMASLFVNITIAQQITTSASQDLESLILENLGQGCVDITNISSSINGQVNGLASFGSFDKANSNFPFQNGIILSTGSITSAGNTLNTSPLNEGNSSWLTDPDLENALNIGATLNATSIEFDFTSVANQVSFNYILASEEYEADFPCQYSDGFAFLIKESGSTDAFTNIALIPGTSIPVNTTTIRPEILGFCPAANEAFFEGYNLGATNYNGRTVVLTATANIIPNIQYRIKLIIADQNDSNYDSAVFIEGNSFNATVDLGADIETCGDSFLLNGNIENNLALYKWYLNGIEIPNATNPNYEATVSGTYKVEISIQLNNTSCLIEDEVNITLNSEQNSGNISNYSLCDDALNDGIETFDLSSKTSEVLISVPPSNYNVSYHATETDAQSGINSLPNMYDNISSPQTIFIRIEDLNNGCLAFATFNLIVSEIPTFNQPPDIVVCDDEVSDGFTIIDLNNTTQQITGGNPDLYVSYHYSQQQADTGVFPIFGSYNNVNSTDTIYIRVFDAATGCVNTTSIEITVLNNPTVNEDNQWIDSCEQDFDGFADFDLTSSIENALQGLTNVTVTFHETISDAQTGTNPIANTTNYQNTVQNFQMVFIRVEDNDTGCFAIVNLELHANIIQTGFNTDQFIICDDASADGIEDFNLNDVEAHILNGYDGFEVTFYATQEDQENNTNALNKNIPFNVTNSGALIYATAVSGECVLYITIDLYIAPPINIQNLAPFEYCDSDSDGFTNIFLPDLNAHVSQGVAAPNIRYFLTEEDAILNENALPSVVYNYTNPFTVYVRVSSNMSGCLDIAPLEIQVIPAPFVSQPPNITICDDDSDGISVVNLESLIPNMVSNTDNLTIKFFEDYNDAVNDLNEIETPVNYQTATRYLFARVENNITTCFNLVGFNVFVNTLPVFIPITTFDNCEAETNNSANFYFYLKDGEILNGQGGKQVLYFETEQDAIERTNIIDKYNIYQNISNPQTIYVRVENVTDFSCYGTSFFELEVGSLPLYNQPVDVFVCDDIANDGVENFDLNQKLMEIEDGIPQNLDITFHNSYFDANNNLNPLPLDFNNTLNPQQVFVRIENGTYCHSVTSYTINIIQVPDVTMPSTQIACDVDYDGSVTFNLTNVEVEILNVRQDNIVVSYHQSLEDANSNTGLITNPNNFNNTQNPQTVYIKVTNTISNCFVALPINLQVNLPPAINEFNTYEICTNDANTFDLNTINPIVTNVSPEILISYHNSQEDADNNLNALPQNYIYSTNNDSIFVRLLNIDTGCYTTYYFNLIVNPLPIAFQPNDIEACDDETRDGIASFNLFSQTNQILGNQNSTDFSVSYHLNQNDANTNQAELSQNYTGANGQIIFARIENNNTGCFSTTQFNLIVNEYPNTPNTIIVCDNDYDGLNSFDLTQADSQLFNSSNPDIVISYFTSIADLESNFNSIQVPQAFQNTTNPQTVYIKTYNTVANCYNFVSLNLEVNLPPTINNVDTFVVCDNPDNAVNLDEFNNILLPQTNGILVRYFISNQDALNETNLIESNYFYQSNNDNLFARVEFSATGCFIIHPFNLFINPLPIANQPPNLEACDDDFDGFLTFNLSQQNQTILGSQNPNDYTVTYYLNNTDAENLNNALNINFESENMEVIFARVENNNTGCFDITQFTIIINPLPVVEIPNQVICLEIGLVTVSANTNNLDDTYNWSTGETTPEIDITEIGEYLVTVTSVFGCETTVGFNVMESEPANIDVIEVIDFSDPNNITITVNGVGNYAYVLDGEAPQTSNVFENVTLGYHTITIIDLNGCSEVIREVVVIDAPKFMTPNNDGYFDTWHISGVETLPGTVIYIFDRYGKLLKTLTSSSPGWDGIYNGQLMPTNDYWFLANVVRGEVNFQAKGHFTLKR